MSGILVFCEQHQGKVKKGSLELLTSAREAGPVSAVFLGSLPDSVVSEVGAFGVDEIFSQQAGFDKYNPEQFTEALAAAVEKSQPSVILASSSALTRDLFPRLAARLKAALATDCTELKWQGGKPSVRRPLYAGKCTAEAQFNNGMPIVLMRPNQLPVAKASTAKAAKVTELNLGTPHLKSLVLEIVKGTSEKLDLTEANIIVSGGRGLQGPEHFRLLEELAETLGATVGASRAVCDAGWVPHSMQVGQTGKTVAPTLYIAIGISGAVQHLAGMSGSKVIVAINKDAEAPIFQKSTYGIVGDLFEVVPALTAEFKRVLAN